ncbi:2047_t:CDS:1, partial [Funneliformis mosseae]
NLKIKLEKCSFALHELEYLRHIVGSNGIKPDSKKLQTMKNLPMPKTPKEVRIALGLFSYYRHFIQNFAKIAGPLHDLTKKNKEWNWTNQHQDSFNTLKQKLMEAPVLAQPDLRKVFILQTDASDKGLGAVFTQKDDQDAEHPITFASKKLSDLELKYTTTEKECLA